MVDEAEILCIGYTVVILFGAFISLVDMWKKTINAR